MLALVCGCFARPTSTLQSASPVAISTSRAASTATRVAPPTLEETIRARLDSLQAQSSFYAKQLASGHEVSIRADVPMNTASVIKIPVMILAFRDADAGRLDLDQRYRNLPYVAAIDSAAVEAAEAPGRVPLPMSGA